MKSLILASVILCSVVLSTVLTAFYTDRLLTKLCADIESEIPDDDYEKALSGITEIENDYNRAKLYFVLFMRENDTHNTESYIEDVKSAVESNDTADIITTKNRLLLHIKQLRRLSVFNLESIF